MKRPVEVFLALGSNQGDRMGTLAQARQLLQSNVQLTWVSSIYQTPPWGYLDQPAFLNQVVRGMTLLSPHKLLAFLKWIEKALGRVENFRYGPRVIDLDILLYAKRIIRSQQLQVPHPRMHERAFVLVPLNEVVPDLILPDVGQSVSELLNKLDTSGIEVVQKKGSTMNNRPPTPIFGKRTLIMGILNVTPDSFSGDGLLSGSETLRAASSQAQRFVEEGADILDIGGESTRPGGQPVSLQEELDRVLPIMEVIRSIAPNTLISIDTYKAAVAEAALKAGAHWINDVWGLHADPEMGSVAAKYHCPIVLMHNRSKPSQAVLQERLGGRYIGSHYHDLIEDVKTELLESVALAHAAGIPDSRIILDPGIGFGKTVEQNLTLVNQLDKISALGYPVLLGASRKSFIGYTLNLPPEERVEGTAAVCAIGIARGADILRVHDVAVMSRVARMTDALVRQS